MKFLRTAPTKRLVALLTSVVAVVVLGATIAIAADEGGPIPTAKPLPNAIHDALAAPEVPGITARVEFTNDLIDTNDFADADPVLTGASGRLWLAPGHGARLELQSENGDVQIVGNEKNFWAYDGTDNTVYRGELPEHRGDKRQHDDKRVPSVARIQRKLDRADRHGLEISDATPSGVAGQPAYTVRVSPQRHPGLLGGAEVAWDAIRGVPLRVAVYARGDASPVLELSATEVEYGPVATSNFNISPPAGAEVVEIETPKHDGKHADEREVLGLERVAAAVNFKLAAPDTLAGFSRNEVRLIDWKKSPAALVSYGEGLDGVAVIQQDAEAVKREEARHERKAAEEDSMWHDDGERLELPSVSINGADAQQIDTPLGGGLRFERDGVIYTVIGSVNADTIRSAARGL